jgi:hypothetical protein
MIRRWRFRFGTCFLFASIPMNQQAVSHYIADTFDNVHVVATDTSHFFFYGPMTEANKFPFATLVTTDEHDTASNLSRPDVYRLNIGVSKATFQSLFGPQENTEPDFTALDRIMHHPVYGMMHWVCVLNPGEGTFEKAKELLSEAHETAARKHRPAEPEA